MRTGKVAFSQAPAPKVDEKVNTLDLDEGDIFESKGELYKVTELDDIGCIARPLNTENWDGIGYLFACETVIYKGK